ncbi:MAG: hydrogenase maturation protease [Bacteroidales bacterium]|jgi:hydrogenase maturation protease|nr:hydrogenase maturation protease [Bacteroidales bacterium]
MKTLILGIGNILLRDEGTGVHAVRAILREPLPPDVDALDGGTGGLHLLGWLDGYSRVIIIDATLDGRPPGTLRILTPRFAADFPPLLSAHETGLKDLLCAMQLLDTVPETILIAVSVADIATPAIGLSPKVADAIPTILKTIKDICQP